jgi:hypothetical protein
MRRLCSRIAHSFSLIEEKHAPVTSQQRPGLFPFVSQFCHRLHVTMVPSYSDP